MSAVFSIALILMGLLIGLYYNYTTEEVNNLLMLLPILIGGGFAFVILVLERIRREIANL